MTDEDTGDQEKWRGEAICCQTDPEAFFPEKGGTTAPAKKICLGCPVKQECLQYALDHDERFGIWGGFSERERRRLKRGDTVTASMGHGGHQASDACYQRGCDRTACRDAHNAYERELRRRRKETDAA